MQHMCMQPVKRPERRPVCVTEGERLSVARGLSCSPLITGITLRDALHTGDVRI